MRVLLIKLFIWCFFYFLFKKEFLCDIKVKVIVSILFFKLFSNAFLKKKNCLENIPKKNLQQGLMTIIVTCKMIYTPTLA
jgi:hypothetical protein